jgi:hypothetical protein
MPITMQAYWVGPARVQEIVFPAAAAVGPPLTLMAVISVAENEKVHAMAETEAPADT